MCICMSSISRRTHSLHDDYPCISSYQNQSWRILKILSLILSHYECKLIALLDQNRCRTYSFCFTLICFGTNAPRCCWRIKKTGCERGISAIVVCPCSFRELTINLTSIHSVLDIFYLLKGHLSLSIAQF
jgi:hypothetical protein